MYLLLSSDDSTLALPICLLYFIIEDVEAYAQWLTETSPDKIEHLKHEHEWFVKTHGKYWDAAKPWTELEEKLFEDSVTTYGWEDWISVARVIPKRTKSKHRKPIDLFCMHRLVNLTLLSHSSHRTHA